MKWPGILTLWVTSLACGATDRKQHAEETTPASSRTGLSTNGTPRIDHGSSLDVADRCAMVEAAFRLDGLKKFACGKAATQDNRILVDVEMRPRFAAGEICSSGVFSIYKKGQPANTDAVLRLTIRPMDNQTWEFSADFFDPPNSPGDHPVGGGFDHINYYCVLIGGRLARSDAGWRAWIEAMK